MSLLFVIVGLLCLGSARAFEDKTVYQYLVDNGYSTLAMFMQSAHLDTQLDGAGPFTVFAPTEAAFGKLDPAFLSSLNALHIKRLVNYHTADGFQLLPILKAETFVTTLEGQNITVRTQGNSVALNNASLVRSPNDIICNNGVVQPIDTVLTPPVFGEGNIADILIMRDDLFKNTLLYLFFANLTETLEIGEYTVFAPVDLAWGRYVEQILHPINVTNEFARHSLKEMLKYLIVPGARTSDMLQNGQTLFTLHGFPLHINITRTDIKVDDGKLLEKDIMASNGVIHAIDNVLYPHDLFLEYLQQTGQTTPAP